LHRRVSGRAQIYFVYIAEAHAVNEWQTDSNEEAGIRVAQHTTLDERIREARTGAERLGLSMPLLVDTMDNAVSETFAAWPERIYMLGGDGRIAFRGGPGPWEFDPDAAAAALEQALA
jgi:hypothetical protein